MSATRSSNLAPAVTEESTPKPASTVGASRAAERATDGSLRASERREALIDFFAAPSPEMREMDAAWEEALVLYGDEDSDAWVSALENGTHPLCRIRMSQRSA